MQRSTLAVWSLIGIFLLYGNALAQPAAAKKAAAKYDPVMSFATAYRQPMLIERIIKNYSLIGQKVLENRARRQMDGAVADFESARAELESMAPSKEIKENYQLLKQLWRDCREIIIQPVSLENAKKLAELNEELVWIATKGAMLIQEYNQSRQNKTVITVGEARTLVARTDLIAATSNGRILTQRIAKLYLFRSWGIRSDIIANDLKVATTEYRAAIDKLLKAPQNDAQINMELNVAETQWLYLKEGITRLNTNSLSLMELEYVAKSCDLMQESLEQLSGYYLKLKISA